MPQVHRDWKEGEGGMLMLASFQSIPFYFRQEVGIFIQCGQSYKAWFSVIGRP